MLSNGQATVVDIESGSSSNWSIRKRSGEDQDQGEENNQLLPHPSPDATKGTKGSLSNLSRFLSRSQNQIQIVPASGSGIVSGQVKGCGGSPHTSVPVVKMPQNNNNNYGDKNKKSVPGGSASSHQQAVHLSPLLETHHSLSAPPSPSAGSRIHHGKESPHHFNNTLTSIDTKLRKWISSKYGRIRKRVVFKNGEVNLSQMNVSKRKRRYLADLFTTLVDIQWRFTLLIFTMSFILSWLFFATVWWTIGYLHGDLDPDNFQKMLNDEFKPCFQNFQGFTSAFLFSIETQHTIGYGSRFTTEECPIAIFTMCMQSIMGVMIQAVMVGIIFAKMSRPKKRTQTLMFSRNAVVCQRDGQLCLMFRVGDMRKSHIISANVRAQLIQKRVTREAEVLPYYQHELKVGVDSDQVQIFFIWPVMVVHKIDAESPLYRMTAADLIKERFEIVVILEGVIETTGATTQARSSYLPNEILWGHRFESMVSFKKEIGEYAVDHTLFNSTYEFDTPFCSAKDLDEMNQLQDELKKQGNNKLLTPFRVPAIAQYSLP